MNHVRAYSHAAMTEHPRCVLAHVKDPERPRPASAGYLCTGHYLGLEKILAELPSLFSDAEQSLIPGTPTGRGSSETQDDTTSLSLRPTRTPFDERVSESTAKLRDLLASWASVVTEEHPSGLHSPRFEPHTLSRFLLTWLPWVCEQPWVDDFDTEVRDGRKALYAALTPSRTSRVPLGPCEAPVACDVLTGAEMTCQGIMEAVVRDSTDDLPPEITCQVCGLSKPPTEWRALSRRWRKGMEPMLTISQLSQVLQVPVRTLARWAAEDDWRRVLDVTENGRRARYHQDDAQASFDTHDRKASA